MLRAIPASLLVLALAAVPAFADKPSHAGKPKGKDKKKVVVVDTKDRDRRPDAVVVFNDRDRDVWRTYWVDTYGRGKCPPGLAKKHNGCLPPGQAKKRYVVGHPLAPSVVIQPLPAVLVTRFGPAPAGYQYAIVDGDVLKFAVGTRLVVDAISALVD